MEVIVLAPISCNSVATARIARGCVVVLLFSLCAIGVLRWTPRKEKPSFHTRGANARDINARMKPIRILPRRRELIPVRESDVRWLDQLISPLDRPENNVSIMLHFLRAHGIDVALATAKGKSSKVIDLLTRESLGTKYFGDAPFVRTRDGIRFVMKPGSNMRWNEAHRDHALGCFAELGVGLDFPVVFDNATGSIREVLADSIANFCLQQQELAWTAVAYALYLPPSRSWSNRFGETTSFDDLTNALLDFPMVDASCAGTHLAYALSVIARVDEESVPQRPAGAEKSRLVVDHVNVAGPGCRDRSRIIGGDHAENKIPFFATAGQLSVASAFYPFSLLRPVEPFIINAVFLSFLKAVIFTSFHRPLYSGGLAALYPYVTARLLVSTREISNPVRCSSRQATSRRLRNRRYR
jgi:hypothetical protein